MEVLVVIGLVVLVFFVLNTFGNVLQLLIAMLFWMVAGSIAGQLIRGRDYGILGNIALGLAGGIVGSFVLRLIGFGGLTTIPLIGGIIAGVIGAVIFVALMRVLVDSNFGK